MSRKMELLPRYEASMILSGVGDALGFKNSEWEFCHSGKQIHKELKKLGGLQKLKIEKPNFLVSDDTVMHLATAQGIIKSADKDILDPNTLYSNIAVEYKECMKDMSGRSAGLTCSNSAWKLKPNIPTGWQIPFNPRGGGCGAAMRAMCIGLLYPEDRDVKNLIALSVESGRMTHHHPTGYLGALAAALFTKLALNQVPVKRWGAELMRTLPYAQKYIEDQKRDVEENVKSWNYFSDKWKDYLELRGIENGDSEPKFREPFGVEERDKFYKSLSFDGWGGASGHDAPMIAYDALLQAGDNWEQLCLRGMLHSGDSDSTGVIAGACFGAMYGLKGVPEPNYKRLEYKERLIDCAHRLFELADPEKPAELPKAKGNEKSESKTDLEEPSPKEKSKTEVKDKTAEDGSETMPDNVQNDKTKEKSKTEDKDKSAEDGSETMPEEVQGDKTKDEKLPTVDSENLPKKSVD